ncbi:hypothetical protein, partial [Fulvivirga kasyanovii]
ASFGQTKDEVVILSRIGEFSKEQLNNSGPSKLTFVTDINKAAELAKLDIQNGIPFLLLKGGIAPTVIGTDPEFEKKYEIYFYEYGCTGPEHEIIIAYNEMIFDFLTMKYGKEWLKEVRKDVIGLKNWKKK